MKIGGDGRAVAILEELELLVLIVDDLEEEHPAQLTYALCIAIHAHVLAHDVLNGFDESADGHVSGGFLVERGLKIMHSPFEAGLATEGTDQLERRAEPVEGRYPEYVGIVYIEYTLVGVFIE